MNQLALPIDLRPEEITREKTLGGAIGLCLKVAGLEPKEVMAEIKHDGKPMDKAQFSRWESGHEGAELGQHDALMEYCGNDAPLLWMLHQRGYDLNSLRKLKTETEKALDAEREALRKAEERVRYFEELMTGRRSA